MLGPRGYAVVTASSGAEALLKVAFDPPDLVLTDVGHGPKWTAMSCADGCARP